MIRAKCGCEGYEVPIRAYNTAHVDQSQCQFSEAVTLLIEMRTCNRCWCPLNVVLEDHTDICKRIQQITK